MSPKQCKFFSACHAQAVYRIPASGLALCKSHFIENVEKRVQETVEHKHMFRATSNDKILVAASGGKDSQVLLTILKRLYPEIPRIEALYVDLGIEENAYSKDSHIMAQMLCNQLQIPFHSISTQAQYGWTIDQLHLLREKYRKRFGSRMKRLLQGECAYCGAFKRYVINRFAVENGFTVVATGHNLTDEATALFINFLNVELQFLARPGPVVDSKMEEFVPRIKPLFYISEDEIIMYAYFMNVPFLPTECPYSSYSPNLHIKQELHTIEESRRGLMLRLMRQYFKTIQPVIDQATSSHPTAQRLCTSCGHPTYKSICSFCRMLRFLDKRVQQIEGHTPDK